MNAVDVKLIKADESFKEAMQRIKETYYSNERPMADRFIARRQVEIWPT